MVDLHLHPLAGAPTWYPVAIDDDGGPEDVESIARRALLGARGGRYAIYLAGRCPVCAAAELLDRLARAKEHPPLAVDTP